MKLPRDLSGTELARVLQVLGYKVTRQTGSHMRLATTERSAIPASAVKARLRDS